MGDRKGSPLRMGNDLINWATARVAPTGKPGGWVVTALLIISCLLSIVKCSAQISFGNTPYALKFRYVKSGELRDTMLVKLRLTLQQGGNEANLYMKWKTYPLAVARTEGRSLGLYSDSTASFTTGQEIGTLYFKRGSSFLETNLKLFVKDGDTPNIELGTNANGDIVMKARQGIGANEAITISRSELQLLITN